MNKQLIELTVNMNNLNKAFADNLRIALSVNAIYDITQNQALIIKNIGKSKCNINGAANRGYHTGTNINYNISSLIKCGYLIKEIDPYDGRAVEITLTEKGLTALDAIDSAFMSHSKALTKAGISSKDIENTNNIIDKLKKVFQVNTYN